MLWNEFSSWHCAQPSRVGRFLLVMANAIIAAFQNGISIGNFNEYADVMQATITSDMGSTSEWRYEYTNRGTLYIIYADCDIRYTIHDTNCYKRLAWSIGNSLTSGTFSEFVFDYRDYDVGDSGTVISRPGCTFSNSLRSANNTLHIHDASSPLRDIDLTYTQNLLIIMI